MGFGGSNCRTPKMRIWPCKCRAATRDAGRETDGCGAVISHPDGFLPAPPQEKRSQFRARRFRSHDQCSIA